MSNLTIRPLTEGDLPSVVAIDAAIQGYSRRMYIERRLAAAQREPALHVQFAAAGSDGPAGYVLARLLQGEFGRRETSLRLELIGVRGEVRRLGAGRKLLDALTQWATRHEIRELRTSASWDDAQMLGWLRAMGFSLAPDLVLGMDAAQAPASQEPGVTLPEGNGPGHEVDFGAPEANDHERLARGTAEIRPMKPADLHEIVRIDRAITGRDRSAYIEARLAEAMEDSAVRISLVGRQDGAIVGFIMGRADLGDFGRTQPVAMLDTIGVDPEYAHRGLGRTLVTRLFDYVTELRVARVETVVKVADVALLGFFQRVGFEPAQRLVFVRKVEE
jgi:ribosomal protein S18 acetylase RimI-like enzyme